MVSARRLGVLRGRVSLPPVIFDVNGMRRDRLRSLRSAVTKLRRFPGILLSGMIVPSR